MATFTPESVLAGCDDLQRAAITSDALPLLVVAGAGSGKTRVLTRRIAWRVATGAAKPERALALTFTRKAAHELRTRLAALGLSAPVAAGTFHSVALAELRRRAFDLGRPMPVVVDAKQRLLDRVLPKRGVDASRRSLLNAVGGEIEWAKARRVTPDAYATQARLAGRRPSVDLAEVAAAYAAYEEEKRKRVVVDLDDLLERLTTDLADDPDFAAASRWRFRHLFVDELQDANPAQLALLDAWLGDSDDLFAVGDARQAIYGWNGAEPDAMARFAESHAGTTTLALTANYRSTKEIVTAASAVLGDRSTVAARTDDGAHPTLIGYDDGEEEASDVARAIVRSRAKGIAWSQCAVLARTNAQLGVIAQACEREGVPLRASSARPFLDSPTVDRWLRTIERSHDPGRFHAWTAELQKRAQGLTATTGEPESVTDDESVLLGFAVEYSSSDPLPTGQGFLAYLREAAVPTGDHDTAGGVDLLTFHRAKGLEWDAVWVVGLENGYVPLAHATTDAQQHEEQRLLYVALTRAREALHCSWAAKRAMGNRSVNRTRSSFLDAVATALDALSPTTYEPQRAAHTGLAASRAALARRARR